MRSIQPSLRVDLGSLPVVAREGADVDIWEDEGGEDVDRGDVDVLAVVALRV